MRRDQESATRRIYLLCMPHLRQLILILKLYEEKLDVLENEIEIGK